MRFYLVDRIDCYEPWRFIQARKLTSRNEAYYASSADVTLVPKQLILEALCQAGSWLALLSSERRKRAALLSIGLVDYLRDVQVGATLKMDVSIDSADEERMVFSGKVTVGDEIVLDVRDSMCVLMDASALEDLDDTLRMQHVLMRESKRL